MKTVLTFAVQVEAELLLLVRGEPAQHLVEYVIVLLCGWWLNYSALIQEVAVDLCPVEGPIRDLHLNKMALEKKIKIYLYKIEWLN